MAWFSAICYLSVLLVKIMAQTNVTETTKASMLVSEVSNQTQASVKITDNTPSENKTVEMHRITQPIAENHSSSQSIGRTLHPSTSISNSSQNGGVSQFKPSDFRPSPQVNTYYEYNRFPVPPAFPEAKTFSGVNINEKPIRSDGPSWFDKSYPNFPTTTQQPWYNKINFPTTQNPFLNVRDQPYPYLMTNGYPETTTNVQYPYVITGTNPVTTRPQYPFVITGTNAETTTGNPGFGYPKFGGFPIGNGANHGGAALGSKFGGFDKGNPFDKGSLFGGKGNLFGDKGNLFGDKGNLFGDKGNLFGDKGNLFGGKGGFGGGTGNGGSSLLQKTHYEQPHYEQPHYEQPHSMSALGGSIGSPWKKIIKFLTAIIPIGLLIGALTPTVINVAPMNGTQPRGRAEDNQNIAAEKLISSLNYINQLTSAGCDERVVCELLMGARSSASSEQHIESLLETFTEQERGVLDNIDELSQIFEAARSGECSSLACDAIAKNAEDIASEKKEADA